MDNEKIGKIIRTKRKEKNITQEQLGEMVGVSYKAVSKWENGRCMPDVSILKKLCEILGVSVDNLLDGKGEKKISDNKKIKKIVILVSSFLIAITVLLLIGGKNKDSINSSSKYNCILTKTYNVVNINESNDENYLFITFRQFQSEDVVTIKLPKTISKDLLIGEKYEFTFNTNKEFVNETIDVIFENSEIINIVLTEKVGMEQKNEYICS